jgi:hypothetical protein
MEIEILRPLFREKQIEDTLEIVRKYLRRYHRSENALTLDCYEQYSFKIDDYPCLMHVNNFEFMSKSEKHIIVKSFLDYLIQHFDPYHDVTKTLINRDYKYDVTLRFECISRPLYQFNDRQFTNGYFIDLYINYIYINPNYWIILSPEKELEKRILSHVFTIE